MASPFSNSIILEGCTSWEWMDLCSFWFDFLIYQHSSKAYFDYTKKAYYEWLISSICKLKFLLSMQDCSSGDPR